MIKDIKHILNHSAVYGLSRVSSKLVAFILLPIITLNFSVSEYGVYVLTESFWQILWAIFLFGLESGIVRWLMLINDEQTRKRFLFSVTVFLLALNTIILVFIYLFSSDVSKLVYDNGAYSRLVLYAALIAIGETFSFIILLILRIEEKAKKYTVLVILSTLIGLVLQVYFIQYSSIKLEGIFISKIIAAFFIVFVMLSYFFRHMKIGFESKLLKDILIYSFPIMISSVVMTLINQADRYILGSLTNLNDVGLFGLAYNISGLINFLVISPFSLAFTVISWKKLNDDNAKRFYTKSVTYLFLAVIYISLGISLFIPNLIKIFTLNTGYWAASVYVPWIILSMPFYGIHIIGIFSFYVSKKSNYILLTYIIVLIIKVLLNFIVIPYYGMFGAAAVNFISFVLLCIIIYKFSERNYFFKYEWAKIFLMVLCFIACALPFSLITFESKAAEILLKIAAISVYPLILYVFRFYEPVEIRSIKGFINKYFFHVKF